MVVPCHAAAATLPALLDALECQTLDPQRVEILLVDAGLDHSAALVRERLRRWSGGAVTVIDGPAGGPAPKRDAGAAAAAGALLAFTDDDCLPCPSWLEHGVDAHRRGACVVQGSVLVPPGQGVSRLTHAITVSDDHGLYEGANMFYDRLLFQRLGGFSDTYFEAYGLPFGEDAELGWRAIRAGATYEFCAAAAVYHPVGPRSLRRHLREQWLGRGFPRLARDLPELRDHLFWHRWFLSRESAETAAALGGLALARLTRGMSLLAVAPYVRALVREGSRDAPVKVASDLVLSAALIWGSARARRVVL